MFEYGILKIYILKIIKTLKNKKIKTKNENFKSPTQ